MSRIFTLCFLFATILVSAQRKPVQGRVVIGALTATTDEVSIKNLQTKKTASTSSGGFFTIQAQTSDTLQLTSNEFKAVKYVLTAADMNMEIVEFKVKTEGTQLSQVTVETSPSARSLGLEPADKKEYTKSERKLKRSKTAAVQRDGDKAYTAVATDRVLNAVSGQTAQAKKEVATEKKAAVVEKLSEKYAVDYYTGTLEIPSDYVKGFQFFAAEDPKFVQIMDKGSEEDIEFALGKLAEQYIKTLGDGKK